MKARFIISVLVLTALSGWRHGVACAEKPGYWQVSDTAELLAAASAIGSEGGTIVLKPGTYTIKDPIVFTGSNVNLEGSGWDTMIKKQGAGDAIVFKGSCWSCRVHKLMIEGDEEAKSGSGIVFKNGEWSGINVIDYCHIRSFAESGVRFEGDPKKPFSSKSSGTSSARRSSMTARPGIW